MLSPEEERTRSRFPALKENQVFFDNAGGSQALDTVIASIPAYLSSSNVQLGASYSVGQRSTAAYRKGYEAGARYINAQLDEIVYGPSTTQLFRNLSFALDFKAGDTIVISAIDHEANISPWIDIAQRLGLSIKWWEPSPGPDCRLEVQPLQTILQRNPVKLVACTHASNILGTITDVQSISEVAHRHGALVCVDAVAYAPHRPIDVKALGVDFYAFSWYKVYGPHMAMLYASWSAQRHVRSLGHFFNPAQSLEDKLGLAGGSYELCQAVSDVVDYLGGPASPKWAEILEHETRLQLTFLRYLTSIKGVVIIGASTHSPDVRLPTISFTIEGWSSKALVEAIEKESNFGLRWGSFYSQRLVRKNLSLGPEGVVRVSMVHYNSGT